MEMVLNGEQKEISVIEEIPCDALPGDTASKGQSGEQSKVTAAVSGAGNVKKSSCSGAAVCLGVMCLLLLIGLVALVFRSTKNDSEQEMNNLTKERDQLREWFDALTKERNDLQRKLQDSEASCKNVTEEKDALKRILTDFGWVYFSGSYYQASSVKKTWQESRDDCLQKGADLVIINSKEEQMFIGQYEKALWIGLTDSGIEGTWKWVDGTPMTTSYWGTGEPNGKSGENCGDIKYYTDENSWNDEACSYSVFWLCEKNLSITEHLNR